MALTPAVKPAGSWPTDEQVLLLTAIVREGPEAEAAWRRWSAQTTLDQLDVGSARLLPLLYRRLSALGIDRTELARLRLVYVGAWQANQLRLHQLAAVAGILQHAGIDVMLLKGAALLLSHYKDHGVRPMADCDLLVPYAMAPLAIERLGREGWTAYGAAPHAQALRHASGFDLDLHWNLLPHFTGRAAGDVFWDAAERTQLETVSVLVPGPADQLLHVCVHGVLWSPTPPVRWIADAMTILREPQRLDWPRMVEQAVRCQVVLPLRLALGYLRSEFNAAVPDEVIRRLETMAVSRANRRRHARDSVATDLRAPFPEAWRIFNAYLDWAGGRGLAMSPRGFAHYLAQGAGVERVSQLPGYAWSRLRRRG